MPLITVKMDTAPGNSQEVMSANVIVCYYQYKSLDYVTNLRLKNSKSRKSLQVCLKAKTLQCTWLHALEATSLWVERLAYIDFSTASIIVLCLIYSNCLRLIVDASQRTESSTCLPLCLQVLVASKLEICTQKIGTLKIPLSTTQQCWVKFREDKKGCINRKVKKKCYSW